MNKKNILQFIILMTLILASIGVAHAQGINPDLQPINQPDFGTGGDGITGGEAGARSITIIMLQILTGGLLFFAAPVAVIVIALNGFQVVTGGADTEQIEQAKKNLTWSLLGLGLIILSYSIVRIIISLLVRAAEGNPLS